MDIPDAPWIRETEATGYCRSGWWNTPPEEDYDEGDDENGETESYDPRR